MWSIQNHSTYPQESSPHCNGIHTGFHLVITKNAKYITKQSKVLNPIRVAVIDVLVVYIFMAKMT